MVGLHVSSGQQVHVEPRIPVSHRLAEVDGFNDLAVQAVQQIKPQQEGSAIVRLDTELYLTGDYWFPIAKLEILGSQ